MKKLIILAILIGICYLLEQIPNYESTFKLVEINEKRILYPVIEKIK